MRIVGNCEEISVSLAGLKITIPYKLPKSTYFCVSIKDAKKTYYKVYFENGEKAKMLSHTRKDEVQIFSIPLINDDGREVENFYFYTKKFGDRFMAEILEKELEKYFEPEEDFEEAMFQDGDEDTALILEEFELEFAELVANSKLKAQNILLSISGYYLDKEIIDNNDFLIKKIDLETSSLSAMLMQIENSSTAIKRIMRDVAIGKASVKHYDSLASLQRVILDINKSQSALIKDLFKDLSDMKDRYKEIGDKSVGSDKVLVDNVLMSSNNLGDIINQVEKLSKGEVIDLPPSTIEEED